MPIRTRVLLHTDGPALWPANRPAEVIQKIKDETPDAIWWSTYQGLPTAPGGAVFLSKWWDIPDTRYDIQDRSILNRAVARFISVDAAESKSATAAYTAIVVADLWPDYRLGIRHVWRGRVLYPEQVDTLTSIAQRWNFDEKLKGVVIENASNGTALIQSLSTGAEHWLQQMVFPFNPKVDKWNRASSASVWCRNGMILLPSPDTTAPWLYDFERELYNFSTEDIDYADQVDAFSQLVLFLELYLSRGYAARSGQS